MQIEEVVRIIKDINYRDDVTITLLPEGYHPSQNTPLIEVGKETQNSYSPQNKIKIVQTHTHYHQLTI